MTDDLRIIHIQIGRVHFCLNRNSYPVIGMSKTPSMKVMSYTQDKDGVSHKNFQFYI